MVFKIGYMFVDLRDNVFNVIFELVVGICLLMFFIVVIYWPE